MIALLETLIAIPKIGAMVAELCSAISIWWISKQQTETYQEIINAAALSARAKTQDDRIKSLQAWRDALSRPRVK